MILPELSELPSSAGLPESDVWYHGELMAACPVTN